MIAVHLDDNNRSRAKTRLNRLHFQEMSLEKFGSEKKRTYYGYLGEELVWNWLKEWKIHPFMDTYEFDFVILNELYEVKTIFTTVTPRPNYLGAVNSPYLDGMRKQEADNYLFCRVLEDESMGWIISYMECKAFWDQSRLIKKGEEAYPGQRFEKANAHVLEYNKMHTVLLLERQLNAWVKQSQPMQLTLF
jgi:hypothetical protein